MPELDGFAVLREIAPDRMPDVIFVTAYDNFAVRAFEAHALDYLVKPVNEVRFEDALTRARDRLGSKGAVALSQVDVVLVQRYARIQDSRRYCLITAPLGDSLREWQPNRGRPRRLMDRG